MSQTSNWWDYLNSRASWSDIQKNATRIKFRLRRKWWVWLGAMLLGAGMGALVSKVFFPTRYKAIATFSVTEDQSYGWEGLLAQFGMDVGGSNPGGLFQGENLVNLIQTRKIIEGSMLKKVQLKGDSILLAQALFNTTKWSKQPELELLEFVSAYKQTTPLHDSVLFLMYEWVRDDLMSVDKPERKISQINLTIEHEDYQLAEALATNILVYASDYYVETLTKKAKINLEVLRREADSVERKLQANLVRGAAETDEHVNPLRAALKIGQNRTLIDLQINVNLYGEIIKNLKLAEISLRKQTPLVEVIDWPKYPFERTGYKFWYLILIGGVVGLLTGLVFSFKD